MAVVGDWERPMADALEDLVGKYGSDWKRLDELEQQTDWLVNPDLKSEIMEKIRVKREALETDYQRCVKRINEETGEYALRDAINDLKKMNGYRDTLAQAEAGEEKIRKLQEERLQREEEEKKQSARRHRIRVGIFFAIAAIVIGAISIRTITRNNRVGELNAQAQRMIDEENERGVTEPLSELLGMSVDPRELSSVTDAALKSVAGREGFAAAFSLEQEWRDSTPKKIVELGSFDQWADQQLASGKLSSEDAWAVAADALKKERLKTTDQSVIKAYKGRMSDFCADAEKGEKLDISIWQEELGEYWTTLPSDPDTALRICLALETKGMPAAERFPEGILLDLPVASYVCAARDLYFSDERRVFIPNVEKVLPVHIIESPRDLNGRYMFAEKYRSEKDLKAGIQKIQEKDSHYTVFLMPEYLMKMPEQYRPSSFAECTALQALQESWVLCGYTYQSVSSSDRGRGTSLGWTLYTEDYRGCFATFDGVVFYDTKDLKRLFPREIENKIPIMMQDQWYENNKNRDESDLYTFINCFGPRKVSSLKELYSVHINNIEPVRILYLIENGEDEETEKLIAE